MDERVMPCVITEMDSLVKVTGFFLILHLVSCYENNTTVTLIRPFSEHLEDLYINPIAFNKCIHLLEMYIYLGHANYPLWEARMCLYFST